jgi:hypothetical protein
MQNRAMREYVAPSPATTLRTVCASCPAPGSGRFIVFTLDDLDELAGYVVAEANHARVKKLEKELRQLYGRIADTLESHTDEPDESAH